MMIAQANGDAYGEVLAHIVGILQEITAEWDVGEISADSRLATLNLESIDLVYFIAELQQKYALQQQLFTRIRAADQALADLRVVDVVDLVQELRGAREQRREELSP
jgi:acyl carrier protein